MCKNGTFYASMFTDDVMDGAIDRKIHPRSTGLGPDRGLRGLHGDEGGGGGGPGVGATGYHFGMNKDRSLQRH